jgi:pyridoxal/pyridoxine/pyridoxamine kinase
MRSKHYRSSCNKKSGRNGHISKWSKNSSKHTVKKKDILIYGTGDAASVLYAEDKYDITKDIIKALNDKYKAAAKTEEK